MENPTLPAHLPLEEALAYYERFQDRLQIQNPRPTTIPIGGYVSFVLGYCPVRSSTSMWLIDDEGKLWTSRLWKAGGEIAEAANYAKHITSSWPLGAQVSDFSPLTSFLSSYAHAWGDPDHTLVLEQFGETCIGLTPDLPDQERRLVRALVVWGFDQEYGEGSFGRAVSAGRTKHRRTMASIRRRHRP